MISLALVRGLADARLTLVQRLTLAHLHGELNWSTYRAVKVRGVQLGIRCTKGAAFKALAALEQLGYLEAHPTERRPKHFRLANPDSLPVETSCAA